MCLRSGMVRRTRTTSDPHSAGSGSHRASHAPTPPQAEPSCEGGRGRGGGGQLCRRAPRGRGVRHPDGRHRGAGHVIGRLGPQLGASARRCAVGNALITRGRLPSLLRPVRGGGAVVPDASISTRWNYSKRYPAYRYLYMGYGPDLNCAEGEARLNLWSTRSRLVGLEVRERE